MPNENRIIKVNALLDDFVTKTYINRDVVAELGLHQGCFHKNTSNVLNDHVETFMTMPVEFELESLDEKSTHESQGLQHRKELVI